MVSAEGESILRGRLEFYYLEGEVETVVCIYYIILLLSPIYICKGFNY